MKYSILLKCNYYEYSYLAKKIVEANINVLDSKVKDKEYFFVIYEDDYEKLKKLDYKKCVIFVGYKGIYNIYSYIKNNCFSIYITFLVVLIMFLSNTFIIKINIHTDNINLNKKIKYLLMDNNVKDFSIMKSYKNIKTIKRKLLNKYNDEIEWIEISKKGYSYDVDIIERRKNSINDHSERCNYVAKKSGTITKIKASKGVVLVQENNYVHQGDILITGEIIYNDELKETVCAQGIIYGEVWYEVDITYPQFKTYYVKNKNKQINISLNILDKKYKLFKNKYINKKDIFKIGNNRIGINIFSSYKVNKKVLKISENKIVKKALYDAKKNIMLKEHNKSKLLSQNILKKYTKNGTIYMKVLITAEEELGVVESY